VDTLNILDSAKSFPDQVNQVIKDLANEHLPSEFSLAENIVISGMGGSALGGRVLSQLERQVLKIPIVVSTEYHLPNFVNEKTLVVISSYSGGTAETIASLAEARARGAMVYILTSGGRLAQIARDQKLPHYIFEPVFNPSSQPRMGLGYGITSVIMLLLRTQLIHPQSNLSKLPDYLRGKQQNISEYEKLSQTLNGKIPILVASEQLKGAIHCFKNQINETAKNMCVMFDIPELNHHLMEGLTFPASNRDNLHFILFNSDHYHPEVKKRYPVTMEVLKKQHIGFSEIKFSGPSPLFEVMELIQSGGFVSFYLSQLNGVDPGPIPWVDYFKDQLK
jgi:glucose/mannose-6-phosphate isomerase